MNSLTHLNSDICFIRGHPKSGTNWVCNLINLHPEANIKGEFHFEHLFEGLQNSIEQEWGLFPKNPQLVQRPFYAMIHDIIVAHCDHYPLCGDRTPGTINSSYIPGKKVVYMSRDGRDVLVSWTYHALRLQIHTREKQRQNQKLFNANPDFFEENQEQLLDDEAYVRWHAKKWNSYIKHDHQIMQKAERGEIDLSYFHIKYEDLHRHIEEIRNRLYLFLGLDPNLANGLTHNTKPGFKKIDNTRFYRSGRIGGWKNYFTSQQLSWFNEEAAEAIELLDKLQSHEIKK